MDYMIKLKFIVIIVFVMTSLKLNSGIVNEQEIERLSRAYGYIIGQDYHLTLIEKEYPDLKIEVIKARLHFNSSFSKAKKIIESELERIFGDYFNDFKSEILNKSYNILDNLDLDKDYAIDFLHEVNLRAEGFIESPVFETLLTYEFIDDPSCELSNGFIYTYTTKNHPKSKGVTINAKLPLSWKQEESDRPNIINKFTSKNYNSIGIVQFMVKDIGLSDDYVVTNEGIYDIFEDNTIKQTIPKGSTFISSNRIVLDGLAGNQIIFKTTQTSLDIENTFQSVHFVTIYESKIIFLQCSVYSIEEKQLDDTFNKFLPLFRKIANSLVFPDQYNQTTNTEKKQLKKTDNTFEQNTINHIPLEKLGNIQIAVTREPTNGLTEEHFKDPEIVKIIEEMSIEKLLEKSKQVYLNQGGTEEFDFTDFSINSDSWNLTIDDKNFVIVKINFEDLIQLITIIGIKNDVFIKISGIRNGSLPIPHSYGPCAKKMEEVFEINIPKLNPVIK